MISNRQADSFLAKLEFDYKLNSLDELINYILILLVLIENPYCFAASSNLLLRKILSKEAKLPFVKDSKLIFSIIKENKVWPYLGLSEIIRRLISTIIDNKEGDLTVMKELPDKDYFIAFNIGLLDDYLYKPEGLSNIKNAISLLYNCVDNIDGKRKIHLDKSAINLFKNHLNTNKNAFLDYLHWFIRFYWYGGSREWHEGKLIVPEPFYIQIFESSEDFLDFIQEQIVKYNIDPNVELILNEIQKFIELYIKYDYVTYDNEELNLTISIHYHLNEELKLKAT